MPGGRGLSPIPFSSFRFGLDAPAPWVRRVRDLLRPELPPVPIGLRPASTRLDTPSRVSPPDAFTRLFASVLRRRHHATRLRFGVCSPATASPHRINRSVEGTTGGTRLFAFSHVRPDPARRVARTPRCDVHVASPIRRAPLLRFSSPSAFAGHARVLMCGGCRPPHDPASPFRRAGPRCSHGPSGVTPTLRVFAPGGLVTMKLAWRACVPSFGTESVAHVDPVPARASTRIPAHRTWRRLDGLLLAAPYAVRLIERGCGR